MLADVMDRIRPRSYPRVYAPKASPTSAFRSMRGGAMSAPIYHEDANRRDSFSIAWRRLTGGEGARDAQRDSKKRAPRYCDAPVASGLAPPAFTAPCRNQTVYSTVHKARDMPSPFQPELSNLSVEGAA